MQAEIVFNGVLSFLTLVLTIYLSAILIHYVYDVISELYFDSKLRKNDYKKGYIDGYEDGIMKANEILKQFLLDYQNKVDEMIAYEGENSWEKWKCI